jgi:hypothetical protein
MTSRPADSNAESKDVVGFYALPLRRFSERRAGVADEERGA